MFEVGNEFMLEEYKAERELVAEDNNPGNRQRYLEFVPKGRNS
jgi:hypothetical protein